MTVPKATVEHTLDIARKSIQLTDCQPVQRINTPEVEFTPTMAIIEYHRYDGGHWELADVRLYRFEIRSTMDLNMYGINTDAMPEWLIDLVHKEMPR